jgi:integrative and conjugative element protein (TIGR02256 family)
VLMGYEAEDATLVISSLIDGGPDAERGRSSFKPDGEWQAKEIARAYEASERRETYLGDWHSHPRGNPSPSFSDQRTVKKIAQHAEARAPRPLMIIAGGESDGWRIAAYRFDGKRLRKAMLRLCR